MLHTFDIDNFEDKDGCPDPDNDQDRILDKVDQCPMDPEDYDEDEDEYEDEDDGDERELDGLRLPSCGDFSWALGDKEP